MLISLEAIEFVERLGSTDFLGAVTALGIPRKTPETGRHATQMARPVPRHGQKRQRPRKRVLTPLPMPGPG